MLDFFFIFYIFLVAAQIFREEASEPTTFLEMSNWNIW